jgi:hypothetical protein
MNPENLDEVLSGFYTIDYDRLSKEMGLHHSYLDFIKSNQLNSGQRSSLVNISFRSNLHHINSMKKI